MAKLNLTVSGEKKRTKIVTKREIEVMLGEWFNIKFYDGYFAVSAAKRNLCPSGLGWDNNRANADAVRGLLQSCIEQIENFDKDAAIAELKQALEQVDEIVELVK